MLSDRYQPKDVEEKLSKWWEERGYFRAQDRSTKPPFCVIMPPPNVTGFLHLGHALDAAIQDCLIRWKRMSGFNALWLPGIDHAGIATQVVVEKEIKKEGLSRQSLGREKFVQKIWDWKNQYGERISNQQKRLGASCDWSRRVFTLDEGVSRAVRKVFVDLHRKGLIYRGKRLVNWSGPLESAISDLEVEHRETKGFLYHLRYKLEDGSGTLIVATTRPETLLGDVAVAVHPDDDRYRSFIGKNVVLPLSGRKIPVLADTFVDLQFGSGVVKITPAHDFNDYQVGKRHHLPLINILTTQTLLNENAGVYQGLTVQAARKKIVEDLKAQDLLEKEEPHTSSIGYCSRTGAVVEPFLSDQWFLKMDALSTAAQRVVESGTLKIEPESWTKVYLHWMNILEDWCISRQLWWGHQIPAWTCQACQYIEVAESAPTQCPKCGSQKLIQDEDVLDTWFSSALWPFSTLGWPEKTEALKTFYPTSVLVTGHDILFFWVARMVIMGLEFMKDVPFRTVYLHGLVRDAQGRKMSKSLGNSIDPVEMIDRFGADALRYSLLAHIHSGKDLKMSEQRIEGYRNFMNKLWNAARFSLGKFENVDVARLKPPHQFNSVFNQWIVTKLGQLQGSVDEAMQANRFSDAASAIYEFAWHEFCDWYLEFSKSALNGSDEALKNETLWCLSQVMNRVLRLIHPFAPFISEEIYQKWPVRGEACIVDSYPSASIDREFLQLGSVQAAQDVDLVKDVISAIRNVRGENRIAPSAQIPVFLSSSDATRGKVLQQYSQVIQSLGRTQDVQVREQVSFQKTSVSAVHAKSSQGNTKVLVVIPLEGLVDFAEEIKRVSKVIEKTEKDIHVLTQKLSNQNFVKNADPEVVSQDRILLTQSKDRLLELKAALERLS